MGPSISKEAYLENSIKVREHVSASRQPENLAPPPSVLQKCLRTIEPVGVEAIYK